MNLSIQMFTDSERELFLWQHMTGQQSGAAAPQVRKYGWAKDKVSRFLALKDEDGNEVPTVGLDVPDIFGRNQRQLYDSLRWTVENNFSAYPVRVRIYAKDPSTVWLERTDLLD